VRTEKVNTYNTHIKEPLFILLLKFDREMWEHRVPHTHDLRKLAVVVMCLVLHLFDTILPDSPLQMRAGTGAMNATHCPASRFLCYLSLLLSELNGPQKGNEYLPPQGLVDGERYDFIVVGGGSAGCVVASR
jgi:hypothetical protein